jgi:hypothetical protein
MFSYFARIVASVKIRRQIAAEQEQARMDRLNAPVKPLRVGVDSFGILSDNVWDGIATEADKAEYFRILATR